MLSSIWKERDSDRSREKGVLGKDVLENNCSKYFLKVSISKFLVKHLRLPAKIWKPIALLNLPALPPWVFPKIKKILVTLHPFCFIIIASIIVVYIFAGTGSLCIEAQANLKSSLPCSPICSPIYLFLIF